MLDEGGGIQQEQRVRTTAKALQEVFGAMPRSRIAVEIGTHSPWISRLLSEWGHEVIVANARKVQFDRGEPQEGRSAGCADVGATGEATSRIIIGVDFHPEFQQIAAWSLQQSSDASLAATD